MKRFIKSRSLLACFCTVALSISAEAKTYLFEDFESVTLGDSVDEGVAQGTAGEEVWTKTAPEGWSIDDSGMAGLEAGLGVTEWRGWSFADNAWWALTAGDQRRTEFTKGIGVVAVADPDEWDDVGSPSGQGTFNSLLSRTIDISGASANSLVLEFDSSFRPEGAQKASVLVNYDGTEEVTVLEWVVTDDEKTNEHVEIKLTNPSGVSEMVITFAMTDAGNNWFWAIDNVAVRSDDLFSEDFEGIELGDSVEEDVFGEKVWSKQGPDGWVTDDSQLYKGEFDPDPAPEDPIDWLGKTEWKGWSFADKDWWALTAGDQRRTEFTKGTGTVAIADPDEWDDSGSPAGSGQFNSFIITPAISLDGVPPGSVLLKFDSSWRPECCDDGDGSNNQTATVTVTFDDGEPVEIMHWSSDSNDDNFHDDNSTNETIIIPIENPDGASSMKLNFGLTRGGNDWWWAIDNIVVSGGGSAILSGVTALPQEVSVVLADTGLNKLDTNSFTLTIDDQAVTTVVSKDGSFVTIKYNPTAAFAPGSEHTYKLTGKDDKGNDVSWEGTFQTPVPLLPETLAGPDGGEGVFGVRYIWGGGTLGGLNLALNLIAAANEEGFEGNIFDTEHEFINHGDGAGLFPDDDPYPEDVEFSDTWTDDDFVQLSKGTIRITEAGEYTFGFHSDDGFAFRIHGANFTSVSGNGLQDIGAPNVIAHVGDTGDSNTRGVITLAAGDYDIEFFWWERGGGDFGEIYTAKGAFPTDGDTGDWALIGSEGGLQLVGPAKPPFAITDFIYTPAANGVAASSKFTWKSEPDASYTIQRSTDLDEFIELTDGYPSEGESTSYTDSDSSGPGVYYRVRSE
ncbi:MAG: PA14 domain-containing protein [Verrucomicrobiales bacterium]